MINAVLNWVSQDISAGAMRENSNIPGLIVVRLREVGKNGWPQIPPGVDAKMMTSLGVDYNYNLLKYVTEVSFICLRAARVIILLFLFTMSTNIWITLLYVSHSSVIPRWSMICCEAFLRISRRGLYAETFLASLPFGSETSKSMGCPRSLPASTRISWPPWASIITTEYWTS